MTAPDPPFTERARELRRAVRTFWWMVVRRPKTAALSRRTGLALAISKARCGVLTGGEHSWGPLAYEYDGARWRRRKCRWCKASMTPASEMARVPFTDEERRKAAEFLPKHPPTDADVQRAIRSAERAGILRNGRWLWD